MFLIFLLFICFLNKNISILADCLRFIYLFFYGQKICFFFGFYIKNESQKIKAATTNISL